MNYYLIMKLDNLLNLNFNQPIGNNYVLIIASIAFALMGMSAFLKPLFITRQFDINELTIAGRNEIRAVYGGFGLFMSLSLIFSLIVPELRIGVALTTSFALGGMAFGRIISAINDKSIGKWPLFYGILELSSAYLILFTN